MEPLLEVLGGSQLAQWLRFSRWGYASVNACHILGIALLVGSILPLDLRLLGAWRSVPLADLARVLVPTAATGLALAMTTGSLLFIVRPGEYASLTLFLVKMTLVVCGAVHALASHLGPGLAGASLARLRLTGATSMSIWLTTLVAGRFLAFVGP